MPANRFWMVLRDDGQMPTKRHASLGAAEREAERLARMCRDKTFIVLEARSFVRASDVIWSHLEELPF